MKIIRAEAFAKDKNAPFDLRDRFIEKIALPPGSMVASYHAQGSEMDPAPLAEALRAAGHVIALPVMAGRDESLIFRIHHLDAGVIPNPLGIGEPAPSAPLAAPDVLLVPLLAFDRQGGRLGMGGGYYDRTIAGLRAQKRILTIGVAFSCQEVSSVPVAPHDARIDRIATEIRVF